MKRAVLCLAVALLFPVALAAQAVTGTILGVITDSTGAVMPGTTVTLTNTGTARCVPSPRMRTASLPRRR